MPNIVLTDAQDNYFARWIGSDTKIHRITGAIEGFPLILNLAGSNCFDDGDKVVFSYPNGDCGEWIGGIGDVADAAAAQLSIGVVATNNFPGDPDTGGYVFRAANMAGWLGLLAIYSHADNDPSPPGLKGAIDAGSNILLITGAGQSAIAPGDKVWLPGSGINGARVLSVQTYDGKKPGLIATLSQVATTAIPPSSPKPLQRKGQLLAYAKLYPGGDGSYGLMQGSIDVRDIRNLPSADACGCDPCDPLRRVGCYQLILARGSFSAPGSGYSLYYASQQFVAETGEVYLKPSIAPAIGGLIA